MTTEITYTEFTNLVPIEYANREKFFLNENNEVTPLIEKVRNHYLSIAIDGSTEEGRKQLKKLAAELNKVKSQVDGYGKEIADIIKAKPKQIDAGRKAIKDSLEEAYETILKPVREYEAEQARIKAEEQAKIEAQRKAEQEELERLRAEKAQQEREARIAEEAANVAKIEAENRAKAAELALQREREEVARKERQEQAEKQRKADEEARRLADVEHRKRINNEALSEFKNFGIAEETAKDVIKLIISGKIPHITINY